MERSSEIMARVNELLPQFGITGGLKKFQEKCIFRIAQDKKDVFCIKDTGSGKSLCYQLPALLLPGVTIVVSPLISLIDDQIVSLEQKNIPAAFLCSVRKLGKEKRNKLKEELRSGQSNIKIIYTTPETLRYEEDFFSSLNISLLVIDEAHCVSVWGKDFRPSYRCIRQFIDSFSPTERPIIAAFTATADRTIFKEIVKNLGLNISENECIGTVKRKIAFDKKSANQKVFLFNWTTNQIKSVCSYLLKHADEKSLVFCRSKVQLNHIFDKLTDTLKTGGFENIKIGKYYGGVDSDSAADAKKYVRRLFSDGEMRIVIATSAFGMGIDIEDIRNIIHVGFPFTMTDYVQQCGRGGRDGNGYECRLYASVSDVINTAAMLSRKYLKMYPLQQGIKIRNRDRKQFIEITEYCLKISDNKNEKLRALFIAELEKFKSLKFPEEYYAENKTFRTLINTSAEIKKKIRRKEISFYEAVLADGVYSLWYNGAESFTPRGLIACVTGNENLNFHNEKRERAEGLIDGLIAKRLLPVVKKTVNGKPKYFFNEAAKECIPGAFPLQENALQKQHILGIPKGILGIMSGNEKSKSQKKRLDEYEQVTAVKYYLLQELNRIFSYSEYQDRLSDTQNGKSGNYPLVYNEAARITSRKIVYLRYDRNAKANRNDGKRAGMLGLIEFSQSTEQLHNTVCAMLDNLIRAGYLLGYKTIYYSEKELNSARKMGWDLSKTDPKGIILLNNNKE